MDNRRSQSAFQTELQNILSDLLFENPGQGQMPRNTFYRRNPTQDNTFYILQSIRETMNLYNENIREYNTNLHLYLQLLELLIRQQQQEQPRAPIIEPINQSSSTRRQRERTRDNPRPSTPTRSQFLSYLIYPLRDISGNVLRTPSQTFQNVIIRPTREQVNTATRTITYYSEIELINHQCPIRLEEFEEGEIIRQIIHCGHAFSEESIQNWFQSNVRCPVCRFDIRDHTLQRVDSQTDISGNENDIQLATNNIIDGLTNDITNIINDYINNDDIENNNIIYNFDYPVYYNDSSGNSNQRNIIN